MNIYYDDKKTPKLFGACKPEVKDGTCSACRHFSSMRGDGRYKYVKWGFCSVIQSNINEHHEYCPMHKRELGEEWKEVKVEQIKEPEVRKLYVG